MTTVNFYEANSLSISGFDFRTNVYVNTNSSMNWLDSHSTRHSFLSSMCYFCQDMYDIFLEDLVRRANHLDGLQGVDYREIKLIFSELLCFVSVLMVAMGCF